MTKITSSPIATHCLPETNTTPAKIEHATPLWYRKIFDNIYKPPSNRPSHPVLRSYLANRTYASHALLNAEGNTSNKTSGAFTSESIPNKSEEKPSPVKHVPFVASPGLLTLTSITLFGEAATHFIPQEKKLMKLLARCSVGSLQMLAGILGMDYYGSSHTRDPSVRSGTMFTGYGLFFLEGLSRLAESRKKNMPITGAFGAGAAFFKTSGAIQPLCSNSYAVDAMANLVEMRHGTVEPKHKGFAKALWSLGHSMERRHIAILQVSAASAMMANAAQKIISSPSSATNREELKQKARIEQDAADEKLERLLTMLENPAVAKEFEKICDLGSSDQFEKELSKFFDRVD